MQNLGVDGKFVQMNGMEFFSLTMYQIVPFTKYDIIVQ